jgi:hypothetical protein
MAVSVDTVYQRVLAILNKEQRGYVTPEEFNLFANQVQLDLFEQYFYDINQFGRPHGNDTEYSDMLNVLNEKISTFEKETNLTYSGNAYAIPSDLYRLGTVIVDGSNIEAEKVAKNEFLYYNLSPLAKPNNSRPIYIRDEDGIRVYGSTQYVTTGDVRLNYIKKPSKVIWNYTDILGYSQYTATGSVDFELHPSEETDIVINVLALCGLVLKDLSVYQIAVGEEQRDTAEEKA